MVNFRPRYQPDQFFSVCGVTPSYTNWWRTEPNDAGGKEGCVTMYTRGNRRGAWNDISCSSYHHYICEFNYNRCKWIRWFLHQPYSECWPALSGWFLPKCMYMNNSSPTCEPEFPARETNTASINKMRLALLTTSLQRTLFLLIA